MRDDTDRPRAAEPPRPLSPNVDRARFETLRADVAARLRGVCTGMSAEQFDALVTDICVMKIRWDDDAPRRPRLGGA